MLAALALARAGAVAGRGKGMPVGEVRGLDGLGHLEDGSEQMGLLGCAPLRGLALSFSLELGFESTGDGVMALRWTTPI